ncbi:MAG: hypothetical protein AAGU12_03695 [Clostridiales bacterium]
MKDQIKKGNFKQSSQEFADEFVQSKTYEMNQSQTKKQQPKSKKTK